MQDREHLVDQHIREYESRQRHVDELLERAEKHIESKPEHQESLSEIKARHDAMVGSVQDFKQGKVNQQAVQAIQQAGPMGVWFGLISELESLLEILEK
ncbi:MAG: hypothetical protein OQL16_07725 [Gammaproteobacteria bacterium]|nr:hypothetical protein [Gammaproteobacteria bacterium]